MKIIIIKNIGFAEQTLTNNKEVKIAISINATLLINFLFFITLSFYNLILFHYQKLYENYIYLVSSILLYIIKKYL